MQTFMVNAFSVAATTTNPNILQGQPIQYWGKPGVLTLYGNASAAGLSMALSLNDGQQNLQVVPTGSTIGVASTAGKVKTNEDFIGQFAIPSAVQLMLPVTNTTAGPLTVNFIFAIT